MALIDIDKFIASIMYRWNNPEMKTIFNDMKYSLIDQGLEYKDNKIVKTQRRVSAEAKENGYSESGEERIRGAITHFISHTPSIPKGIIGKETMLAWLEKQDKQKVPVVDFKAEDWHVSKVDGKIHNIYHSVDKVEPKFKVKYAGREYNVLEIKENMGITWYGIEDEPNHIDYVKANSCEIISGYAIKENGSPYPTKPAIFAGHNPTEEDMKEALRTEYEKGRADAFVQMQKGWSEKDEKMLNSIIEDFGDGKTSNMLQEYWLKSLKQRIGG